MALKIGFIPIEGGHYYGEALEEVTRAEELGFDSVWMEEHHSVTNHYWPSPLTVLAGFATRTSRLVLGTDIIVAAFHHPVRLAEDVAMLDVISNGRLVLGIAIGYKPDEFALYGVELEKRGARFEEQLAIMKGLWTQERVQFKGHYYTLEGRCRNRIRRCGSAGGATSRCAGRRPWPTTGSRALPPTSGGCWTARRSSSTGGVPPVGRRRPSGRSPAT
jgi:alkanesulfonate monooxygenase SsuD/methylene tetrahydromethanopterin reductase-like flavin-dependent oxidoreductase (luciferase family)